MKKVLFVATVVKKHINVFHLPYLKWFKENGFETHVCAGNDFENKDDLFIDYCDKYYDISFERSPFKKKNIRIYKQLKEIIDGNNYDIIHCHTPMGGALARLAARESREKGTKIIYTAHGFHFFKGAPVKNWLMYYSIEKWLSKYTDCLITINREDNELAVNNFKANEIRHVHGVGVDFSKYFSIEKEEKEVLRSNHGFNNNDFILIYPAELNANKNQDLLINTVGLLRDKIPNIKLILAGQGNSLEKYKNTVKEKGLTREIIFPGFREDIDELIKIANVSVASSIREGLGLNVIEGMACGLPVIATENRGHKELVTNGENGYLIKINNVVDFANAIKDLYFDKDKRVLYGKKSIEYAQIFSLINVQREMEEIYQEYL